MDVGRDRQPGPRPERAHLLHADRAGAVQRRSSECPEPRRLRTRIVPVRPGRVEAAAARSRRRSSSAAARIGFSSAARCCTQTSRCSEQDPAPIPIRRADRSSGSIMLFTGRRPADGRRRRQRALGDGQTAARQGPAERLAQARGRSRRGRNGSLVVPGMQRLHAGRRATGCRGTSIESVQLFPRDPEMLFLAACAREMFSGPQIQNVLHRRRCRAICST